MKKFFNLRIFWICQTVQKSDGYFHHEFRNWFNGEIESVFAGYNWRALNKRSTSWETVKGRL